MLNTKKTKLLSIALLLCSMSAFAWDFEVEQTQEQLQERITRQFPSTYEQLGFTLTLQNPIISLKNKSNRIYLDLDIKISSMGNLIGKAKTRISGQIFYDEEHGAFYLNNPKIEKLESAQLDPQFIPLIRDMISLAAQQLLPQMPVYILNEKDFQQKILKKRLRSIEVRDKKLIIIMKLD